MPFLGGFLWCSFLGTLELTSLLMQIFKKKKYFAHVERKKSHVDHKGDVFNIKH